MSNYDQTKIGPKIISDEFVMTFSDQVDLAVVAYRSRQPEFEKYQWGRTDWSNVLDKLDKSLYWEYENEVVTAAANLEGLCGDFFWVLGLKDAVAGHIKSREDILAHADIPGWEDAEKQLATVCDHFTSRLSKENKSKCSEHLKMRKELIKESRYLYYCHGVEFTQAWLRTTGLIDLQ